MSQADGVVAGQMQPTNTLCPLSLTDLYFHVLAQVEQYAMNSAMFISEIAATETKTPANFALYLFGMALSHINIVGQLGGANKNDVCLNPGSFALPTGFAKYLEHLGPYESDGCLIRTSAVLSSALSTTSALFGINVPSHFWGATPTTYTAAANQFGLLRSNQTAGNAVGEYVINTAGLSVTLIDLWSTIAGSISQEIVSAGLSCVLYKDIPKKAPNSSAYAYTFNPVTGARLLPSVDNAMWTCVSPDFSNEEALLFSSFQSDTNLVYMSNFQKCVCSPGPTLRYDPSVAISQVNNQISPHYFNAWIGSRQSEYRPGPILGSYLLCTQKVESLGYSIQPIDVSSIAKVSLTIFNQFLRQTTNPLTDAEINQLIYLYFQFATQLVVTRVNQCTPIHYLCISNRSSTQLTPTFWVPQSAFVSRAWMSVQIPPPLARFIDSIGPVLIKGMMVVPVLQGVDSTIMPNYGDGTTWPRMSIGSSAGQFTSFTNPNVIGNPGLLVTGVVPPYDFAPESANITNASLLVYYPDGTTQRSMLFWNSQLAYFTGLWDRLHKKSFSGVGVASSLIHLHNPPCGTVSAMLTGVTLGQTFESVNVPDLSFPTAFQTIFNDPQPLSIASYVNMTADEIVEAIMFRFLTFTDSLTNTPTGKFIYRVPTASAGVQLLQSYTEKTFSPESSFSKSISIRESKFDPVVKSVGGVQVVSTEETRGCWIRDGLKTVAREGFSALRYATPAAAGLVCNAFVPGSGAACSWGAGKVIQSIMSYKGVEADGHEPPTNHEIAVVRGQLSAPMAKSKKKPNKKKKKQIRKKVVQTKSRGPSRSRSRSTSRGRVPRPRSKSPAPRRVRLPA